MVLTLQAPEGGVVRLHEARIERARRIRTTTGYFGAFDLSIPHIGVFRECRLVQYRRGGFFATGEHRVNMTGRRYVKFFDMLDPFSTWVALQARLEILHLVYEVDGELLDDRDELLPLDENELAERCEPAPLDFESCLRIEIDPRALHESRPRFSATIGDAIRVRDLRVAGDERNARLISSTSDGLTERPLQLDRGIEIEIVERYFAARRFPEPPSAVA